MFKIQPNPTFDASIKIVSHCEEQTLNLTFRAKPADEYQALLTAIGKEKDAKKAADAMADAFLQLVEKWDADMELNRESVFALNNHRPGAVWHIVEAYGEKMIAARKGN